MEINKVELCFVGTGSAFTIKNFHTNAVLTVSDGKDSKRLLIDAGSDIRRSMAAAGMSLLEIDGLYLSHLHADHSFGVADVALMNFFAKQNLVEVQQTEQTDDTKKPELYGVGTLLKQAWDRCLSGALATLEGLEASLDTYFRVRPIPKNRDFNFFGLKLKPFQTVHVVNKFAVQDSWGLMWECPDGTRVLHTTDTQFAPSQLKSYYQWASIILHDCETSKFKSGVHSHYTELLTLPEDIRAKMWLFHYQDGPLPDAKSDGFLGFIAPGQKFCWEIPMESRMKVMRRTVKLP